MIICSPSLNTISTISTASFLMKMTLLVGQLCVQVYMHPPHFMDIKMIIGGLIDCRKEVVVWYQKCGIICFQCTVVYHTHILLMSL